MDDIIGGLRREHANIAKLLSALERQLVQFIANEPVDYDIIQGIADYFVDYPELCHHPKENAIYHRLLARDADAAGALGDLKDDHDRIGTLSLAFAKTVRNVLGEAVVPRKTFEKAARNFIDLQRKHMEMEERTFFPAVLQALTAEDWAEVKAEIHRRDDPLFGSAVEDRFRAAAEDILEWDRSERAG